jgi:hypothetical protein
MVSNFFMKKVFITYDPECLTVLYYICLQRTFRLKKYACAKLKIRKISNQMVSMLWNFFGITFALIGVFPYDFD